MRTKSMWIGMIVVLVMTATTALTLASNGASHSSVFGDIDRDPPGDDGCVCPANYQPVICKAPDGTEHQFSNSCVAGCSGYTKCYAVERLQ